MENILEHTRLKLSDRSSRLESLRNDNFSVMIRATPNSVRWNEVNQVQYRFQALNFHSDAIEALSQPSPPLIRRERASTSDFIKEKIAFRFSDGCSENPSHSRIKCIQRSSSFDFPNKKLTDYCQSKRKGSVVQISKDDTSDYNSDEEVFTDTCNTTLYHIENRQITDRTKICITRSPSFDQSTKTSIDSTPISNEEDFMKLSKEDLELKSKRDLINIVIYLQSVNKEKSERTSSTLNLHDDGDGTIKSVSSLIKDFQDQINEIETSSPTTPVKLNIDKSKQPAVKILSSVNEDNIKDEK